MRFVVSGASGFLGPSLIHHLRGRGHEVTRLVRSPSDDADTSLWDPAARTVDDALVADADVVINLAGASIQRWPRTHKHAEAILNSRVDATATLAEAIAAAPNPPAFLSGSGMSWYGVDRGAEELDESSAPGTGFLATVAQAWERAALPAKNAGGRVAHLRTSIVLDDSGGALRLMKLPFALGLGARLGSGRQYFSVISRHDWVRAVTFAAEHDVAGPVNLAVPTPTTNAEFTKALARELRRPVFLAAPSFAIKAVLGGLADDLLGSLRVRPLALEKEGFVFDDPDLEHVLRRALA